jgi:hypothetical protein
MNGWNIAKVVSDVEAAKTEEAIQQKLIEMGWTPPLNDVNRVEVIDETGRVFAYYLKPGVKMTISMQDDNKTMKIFIGVK